MPVQAAAQVRRPMDTQLRVKRHALKRGAPALKQRSIRAKQKTAILDTARPQPLSARLPGAVAQLVERLVRNEKVSGSIPLGSTRNIVSST